MSTKLDRMRVALVVATSLAPWAAAQTYQPGPAPTVGDIQHQTVSPLDPSRTTIGIGESVNCWIDPSTWQDADIWTDPYGNQSTVYDGMGTITWTVSGAGALVEPVVGNSVTLTANLTDADDSVTLTATIPDSGTMGLDLPLIKTLAFAVNVPKARSVLGVADDPKFGTPPPPKNVLGFLSTFTDQITPNTVDFGPKGGNVSFRENLPGDSWTWPDGTKDSTKADNTDVFAVSTEVNGNTTYLNVAPDTVAEGGEPVTALAGKNFTITIRVPLEYQDGMGKWISFFPNETHDKEFRGATLDGRGTVNATNTVSGGWQGPWKSVP